VSQDTIIIVNVRRRSRSAALSFWSRFEVTTTVNS